MFDEYYGGNSTNASQQQNLNPYFYEQKYTTSKTLKPQKST
jgi:hypothetical protein